MIPIIKAADVQIQSLRSRRDAGNKNVTDTVADILRDVRNRGDDAVLAYTKRFDGADLSAYSGKTGGFKDVEANSYYAAAVAWGAKQGIITGYNKNAFGVGDPVTREQVCTIIYRYMGSPSVSDADGVLAKFSDKGKISAYAYTAMAWCVENGIISGKNATTVAPLEGASRAQIATIIMRMDQAGMFSD